MRQVVDRINAEVFWLVFFVAITEWNTPRPPATALSTAGKHAYSVEKLVRGIGFPTGWFTAAGYNDAWTVQRFAGPDFDSGG